MAEATLANIALIMLIAAISMISLLFIVANWIVYKKCDTKGWYSIIPIYNYVALFRVTNIATWMVILLFIPIANIYVLYLAYTNLAIRLGRSKSFGILTLFFSIICIPILAFFTKPVNKYVSNSQEEVVEEPVIDTTEQILEDGPIAPLEPLPDMEDSIKTEMQPSKIEAPVSFTEMSNETPVENPLPTYEELYHQEIITPVVPVNITDPLTAQQKGQQEKDVPDVLPDVNVYKECPDCGTKVEPSAHVCFLCGHNFDL